MIFSTERPAQGHDPQHSLARPARAPACDGNGTPSPVDAANYRTVLSHFPTGVAIVTGLDSARAPRGFTVGSFTSISLDPALVGFFVMLASERWQAMRSTSHFCVNVLDVSHRDISRNFAISNLKHRFADIDWVPAPSGAPILPGVVAWIDCSIVNILTLGDHYLVIGSVDALGLTSGEPNPLLFFRGHLGGFQHQACMESA
jgi:3-hydroxy-9,10-secoandrosta-1,3,5(10)-triene-9,17-dione monooxygenase reductase component